MRSLRPHDHHERAGRALTGLYRDHAPAVFRYAFHLTGSREDAEDLVQTAFLEAHRRMAAGEAIVNPRAWLSTVVRHRAFNLARDRREEASSDRIEVLAGAPAEAGRDAAADLDRVRAVLYQLPAAQHQAFVLRHWSDLSYREIAAVLGTSEAAVESLLVRARAAVMGHADLPDECVETRARLSADAPLGGTLRRHLDSCPRCRTAQSRLARAAGIAAAAVLVPRMHVAQALAAAAPGFSAAGAAGAGTASAAGTLAAGKAGIVAKAAVAVVAVAGSAAAIHAHAVTAHADPVIHHHVRPPAAALAAPAGGDPVTRPVSHSGGDGPASAPTGDGSGGHDGAKKGGTDTSGSGQDSGGSGGSGQDSGGSTSGQDSGGSTSGQDSGGTSGGTQTSGDTSGSGGQDTQSGTSTDGTTSTTDGSSQGSTGQG